MKIWFGVFKGEDVSALPTSYLEYLVDVLDGNKSDANRILIQECQDELDFRMEGLG